MYSVIPIYVKVKIHGMPELRKFVERYRRHLSVIQDRGGDFYSPSCILLYLFKK